MAPQRYGTSSHGMLAPGLHPMNQYGCRWFPESRQVEPASFTTRVSPVIGHPLSSAYYLHLFGAILLPWS